MRSLARFGSVSCPPAKRWYATLVGDNRFAAFLFRSLIVTTHSRTAMRWVSYALGELCADAYPVGQKLRISGLIGSRGFPPISQRMR